VADFRKEFIAFCIEQGVLKFGRFVTKSGRTTPYFFNAGLFNTGAALDRLGQFYAKAILASGVNFDMLFGPAYKGIVLVASAAVALVRAGRNCPSPSIARRRRTAAKAAISSACRLPGAR